MDRMLPLVAIGSALLMGLLTTFVSALQMPICEYHDLSARQFKLRGRRLLIAWVYLMPLGGYLADRFGCRDMLVFGSLGIALGIAWLGLAHSRFALAFSSISLAFGCASFFPAAILLMPRAFLPVRPPGAALCVGFFFIGIAALLTPFILPHLIRRTGIRVGLTALGLVSLLPGLLAALMPHELFNIAAPTTPTSEVFLDTRLWLIALAVLLFFPIEHALDIWPNPYLIELGYRPGSVRFLVGAFWVAFLGMRLAVGWVPMPYQLWLLLVLMFVAPMILGNLAGAYAPSSGLFGFWCVGACYGPLLPVLFGELITLFAPHAGFVLGLMLALDSLCAFLILPWFLYYVKLHPTRQAMRIPLALGLAMAAPTLILLFVLKS